VSEIPADRTNSSVRYLTHSPHARGLEASAWTPMSQSGSTVWRDGTSHFLFEPIEFLEKLAAIIPRPAVNLLLYHGILAPHARWRSQVVRYGRPSPEPTARQFDASPRAAGTPCAWTWAALMRRVSISMSSPVPAVAAGCASSPPSRTPAPCRPSSPTLPAPAPPRRPAPPHRRPPQSRSPPLSSALDAAPDSRRRTPLPAP